MGRIRAWRWRLRHSCSARSLHNYQPNPGTSSTTDPPSILCINIKNYASKLPIPLHRHPPTPLNPPPPHLNPHHADHPPALHFLPKEQTQPCVHRPHGPLRQLTAREPQPPPALHLVLHRTIRCFGDLSRLSDYHDVLSGLCGYENLLMGDLWTCYIARLAYREATQPGRYVSFRSHFKKSIVGIYMPPLLVCLALFALILAMPKPETLTMPSCFYTPQP